MALEYIKALEKQKTGEQAKFKESTAVFSIKIQHRLETDRDQRETIAHTLSMDSRAVPEGFHILPKVRTDANRSTPANF